MWDKLPLTDNFKMQGDDPAPHYSALRAANKAVQGRKSIAQGIACEKRQFVKPPLSKHLILHLNKSHYFAP
jgi:hypothetical protein